MNFFSKISFVWGHGHDDGSARRFSGICVGPGRRTHSFRELKSKYIFGFTVGSDIRPEGERELESTSKVDFQKRGGSYGALEQEVELEYNPIDSIQIEAGAQGVYDSIRGVLGNAARGGIARIERAASRMKDILEIRLDEKAGDDLRLMSQFETGLVVEERDGPWREERDVESALSRLRRNSLIGSRCPKRIIGPLVPKSNEIDARVGIEINAVAIGWSRGNSRENPPALFWVVSRQAPNHLIDQAIDPRIAAMDERIASAQRIGEQQAIGANKLSAEVPEMMQTPSLIVPARPAESTA